jgi:hypothetical protein
MADLYGEYRTKHLHLSFNLTPEHFTDVTPLLVETDEKTHEVITLSDLEQITIEDVLLMESVAELPLNKLVLLDVNLRLYYCWQFLGFKNGIFGAKTFEALNQIVTLHPEIDIDYIKVFSNEVSCEINNVLYSFTHLIYALQNDYFALYAYICKNIVKIDVNAIVFIQWISLVIAKKEQKEQLIEWSRLLLNSGGGIVSTSLYTMVDYYTIIKEKFGVVPKTTKYFIDLMYVVYAIFNDLSYDINEHQDTIDSLYHEICPENGYWNMYDYIITMENDDKLYKIMFEIINAYNEGSPDYDFSCFIFSPISEEKLAYIYDTFIKAHLEKDIGLLYGILVNFYSLDNDTNVLYCFRRIFTDFPNDIISLLNDMKENNDYKFVITEYYIHRVNSATVDINTLLINGVFYNVKMDILIYCVVNGANTDLVDEEKTITGTKVNLKAFLSNLKIVTH